jgi:hypothetical protein
MGYAFLPFPRQMANNGKLILFGATLLKASNQWSKCQFSRS